MRVGDKVIYLEPGKYSKGEGVISVPVEDVIACSSTRGPVNTVFVREDQLPRHDTKSQKAEFQRKLQQLIPTMVEIPDDTIYHSHGDEYWMVDTAHIDWDATRAEGKFGVIHQASRACLIMDSGLRIELEYSKLIKFIESIGKLEDIVRPRVVSFPHGDSNYDEIVFLLFRETTYSEKVQLGDCHGNVMTADMRASMNDPANVFDLLNLPECGFAFLARLGDDCVFVNSHRIDVRRSLDLYDPEQEGCLISFSRPDGTEMVTNPGGYVRPHDLRLLEERIAKGKRFLDEEVMCVTTTDTAKVIVIASCLDGKKMPLVPLPGEFDHLTDIGEGRYVNARTLSKEATLQLARDLDAHRVADSSYAVIGNGLERGHVNQLLFDPMLCRMETNRYLAVGFGETLSESILRLLFPDLEDGHERELFVNTRHPITRGSHWIDYKDVFLVTVNKVNVLNECRPDRIYLRNGEAYEIAGGDFVLEQLKSHLVMVTLVANDLPGWINTDLLDPDASRKTFAVMDASSNDKTISPDLRARFMVPKHGPRLWKFAVYDTPAVRDICGLEKT